MRSVACQELSAADPADPGGEPTGDVLQAEASGRPAEVRGWRQRVGDRRAAAVERLTPWPQANRFGTRALLLVLIVGVLAGPAALLRPYATSSVSTAPEVPVDTGAGTADVQARARTQATGAASSLVWTWLSAAQADADALQARLEYPPAQLNLPQERPSPPSSVTVLDATRSGTSWMVTVSARGGLAGGGATYRVAVQVDERGATPLTLPGQIPGPGRETVDRGRGDGPDQVSLSADDPAATAAGGFVQTLLSGTGDLSRWTSPGSNLTAIRPATCATVSTTASSAADPPEPIDGQSTEVLATAACRRTTGRTTTDQTLQYLLTLIARGGRWEVTAYTSTPGSPASGRPAGTSPTEPTSPAGPDPAGSAVPNAPADTSPADSPTADSATPR